MKQNWAEHETDESSSRSLNKTYHPSRPPAQPPQNLPPHSYPVRYIAGVGPKIASLLAEKGIETAEDLLQFFPYKYLDRRHLTPIGRLSPGEQTVIGKIVSASIVYFGRRRVFEIILQDETGAISLKWFHFYPRAMHARFKEGVVLRASGEVTLYRGDRQFVHPEVEILDADLLTEAEAPGIIPVYSQILGLGQRTVRKIIQNSLNRFEIPDRLPVEIRERHHLLSKQDSISEIHFPPPEISIEILNAGRSKALKREIFEEFFFMELALALKRRQIKKEPGTSFDWEPDQIKQNLKVLPFQLTRAQRRVLKEILDDMKSPFPMHRLVQGDVGCGKTIVALMAALTAIQNGAQAALMAPTEILAEQHLRTAGQILGPFKIPVALLKGSQSESEKEKIRSRIRRGIFPLVIGTHALITKEVAFKNLGLAIVDEQHRFGVLQRAALKEKGRPDLLVMTATPIPRTLAMTLYGDLDLSVIDEMPPGRQPIETIILESKSRSLLYGQIQSTLERGEQAYIVYPLVEESEKLMLKDATRMFEELKKVFPQRKLDLLHGRIKSEEKEKIFREFKEGRVNLLVSTTVIEVGIDVPNATLMVIEHADRFGLSQLHQLRGRVGRGEKKSHCILMSDYRKSEEAYRRLQVMTQTEDGFKIAEADLEIRGPGDFLGTRQAGLPELKVGHLIRDYSILQVARQEAFQLIEKDPELCGYPNLRSELAQHWKERLELASV